MSLPSDYTNEIEALSREVRKQQPNDILQFCTNFFQRRLESQRAEFLLSQRHSSQSGGMAESNFPGSSNPFGATSSSGAAAASTSRSIPPATGMHSVAEEEEHDFASPTASSFPPNVRDNTAGSSTFGSFAFNPSSSAAASGSSNTNSMDAPQSYPKEYNLNRRTSVSAESLAPSSATDSNWKVPSFPKTSEQQSRLKNAVSHNFLFSHLDDEQLSQVLGALQERKIPAKDVRVIAQGDTGDYFYVVESGNFDIFVSKNESELQGPSANLGTKVATNGPGTSFGELALMYNAPRAATVVSTEPGIVWQLDRVTFRRILMDSAFQRRRMYESFLEEVPILATLTAYERSKIADALETVKYPPGSQIIREGDVGDKFYILESGTAVAVKHGNAQPLKSYSKGDYFGELALLEDKPRAATVQAETEVKLASLGKDGFQRLLGPVESIMRRNDPRKADS